MEAGARKSIHAKFESFEEVIDLPSTVLYFKSGAV